MTDPYRPHVHFPDAPGHRCHLCGEDAVFTPREDTDPPPCRQRRRSESQPLRAVFKAPAEEPPAPAPAPAAPDPLLDHNGKEHDIAEIEERFTLAYDAYTCGQPEACLDNAGDAAMLLLAALQRIRQLEADALELASEARKNLARAVAGERPCSECGEFGHDGWDH